MTQKINYLDPVLNEMAAKWPNNRTVNIVCHGHSVPAGYFATPFVNTFSAYPHLMHKMIKERFPYAVLSHRPDVLTIDYSLNDRAIGLEAAQKAWCSMIEQALERGIKIILCTPTWDNSYYSQNEKWDALVRQAEQVRSLADRYDIGLADSFKAFEKNISEPSDLAKYLSHVNHPTEAGHRLVAEEIAKYFIAR